MSKVSLQQSPYSQVKGRREDGSVDLVKRVEQHLRAGKKHISQVACQGATTDNLLERGNESLFLQFFANYSKPTSRKRGNMHSKMNDVWALSAL